jgi:hypothetical protein
MVAIPAGDRVAAPLISAAVVVAWAGGLAAGVSLPSLLLLTLAVAGMHHCYRVSSDLLDFRAGFFFAVLLIVGIPSAVLDVELAGPAHYWASALVRSLIISHDQLRTAQLVVLFGTAAVALPLWLQRLPPPLPERTPVPLPRIWYAYAASLLLLAGVAWLQYGGPAQMALYLISPEYRLNPLRYPLAGLTNLGLFLAAISAYFAAQRLDSRVARAALFVPVLILLLPAGNRGSLFSVVLIGMAATMALRPRQPVLYALAAALVLPAIATLIFRLRRLALLQEFGAVSLFDLYAEFTAETLMLPTLAVALDALGRGVIDYAWGADLVLFPLYFVPRLFWPGKPPPLDFRLSESLGLHDGNVFGTPVTLFGGLWFNFTPVLYLPACLLVGLALARAYRRVRHDRLLRVLLLTFVIDIVRVGDIARELLTLTFALTAAWAIYFFALPRHRTQSAHAETQLRPAELELG